MMHKCRYNPRQLVAALALLLAPAVATAGGAYWSTEGQTAPDSGSGSKFGGSYIGMTLPLGRYDGSDERASSSLHLDITEFRWSGTTAAQNEYYWLSVPVEYRQRRNRSSEFIVRAEPGLMTDLNVMSSDSLAMNLDLIGRVYQRSGTFWQFGLTVDRAFGDFNPRPLAAVAWKAGSATEVLLGFPQTRIQTRWTQDLSGYLHLRPAGGVWEEEVTGLTGTYRVSYTNWKLGLGSEFHWRGPLWLSAELGQMRHRRIRATDDTGTELTATPADAAYWQAGLILRY